MMSRLRPCLLQLYYYGTYPARVWRYWREVSRDHLPAIVLFYHRIADDRATPWTLSNAMFQRQMHWLAKSFEFVSLEEVQKRVRQGYNLRPCVSITFDDGYAENCQQAIPFLVKEQIPCTYFVTAQNVLHEEPFAHDLVLGKPLVTNNLEQLRGMAAAGVEIGAHTFTHADLGSIVDPRLLRYEMIDAKEALEEAIGRPMRHFSFPFGLHQNLSSAAFQMAREAGYETVCSAYGGYNFPGDDPFHLQRIGVDDTMIRLKNWVTMDPRKLRTRRYIYEEKASDEAAQAVKDDNGNKRGRKLAKA